MARVMEALPVSLELRLAVAAVTMGALSAPAAAASVQDIRCYLLSNIFAQKAGKEEGRRLAQATGLYYSGKLNGTADADLRRAFGQQQKVNITAAAAASEMQNCAREVQGGLQRIQSLIPHPAAPAKK